MYGEFGLQLVPWSMSGIQKILQAECMGLFVCSQPFCRQSVSISLFVLNLFAGRVYGQTLLQSQVANFSGLSPDLVRDVVTPNLPRCI